MVPEKPHHTSVTNWLNKNTEALLTTDYCLAETLNLFGARRRPQLAFSFGKSAMEGKLGRLHFLTQDQVARALILRGAKSHFGWSFTDCTNKIFIDEHRIKTTLALDQHFRQFGIKVVP